MIEDLKSRPGIICKHGYLAGLCERCERRRLIWGEVFAWVMFAVILAVTLLTIRLA